MHHGSCYPISCHVISDFMSYPISCHVISHSNICRVISRSRLAWSRVPRVNIRSPPDPVHVIIYRTCFVRCLLRDICASAWHLSAAPSFRWRKESTSHLPLEWCQGYLEMLSCRLVVNWRKVDSLLRRQTIVQFPSKIKTFINYNSTSHAGSYSEMFSPNTTELLRRAPTNEVSK